jgi:hypothetical protein
VPLTGIVSFFTDAGFRPVEPVRAVRNGRTKNPHVLAAVFVAVR